MTKTSTWILAGATVAMITGGCATAHHEKPAAVPAPVAATAVREVPGGMVEEGMVTMAARVEAVDLTNRVVTLRGPDGKIVDVEVGDEVRNLPQVHKGDEVVATYYESIAISVRKPGDAKPGIVSADTASRAELGQKPGGKRTHQTTLVATVVGLNKRESTATLKGPRGKTATVKVNDPSKLDNVKVGDLVEVVYTEALAISVEKPEAAKKQKHH